MRLEDNALSGSGVCALSGNSNGPFVATDFQVDPRNLFNGAIYVNAGVVLEMAEVAGAVRPETYATALGDLAAARTRIEELERETAGLKAENDALIVFAGGKVGARASAVRREAGFKGRKEFDKERDWINGAVEGETEDDIAESFEREFAESAVA